MFTLYHYLISVFLAAKVGFTIYDFGSKLHIGVVCDRHFEIRPDGDERYEKKTRLANTITILRVPLQNQ